MTIAEKLTALTAMTGGTDAEEVLSIYLSLAASKILARAYPYRTDITDVPAQYDYLHLEIAAYMLNKRGAEGQVGHNENGISRSYENADVPVSMLSAITPAVGVMR